MKQLSDTKVFTTRLNMAQNIWQLMQDKANLAVKMPHDGYLKLFYLSKPVFNVNCIMLDEAQDSNDVTLAIIDIAKCKHKIVVGDVHQAIYQFRGAKNSLTEFKKIANKTFYLTNSFRFNNNIADYASLVLGHFKNETNKVVGVGAHGEKLIIDGSKIKNIPKGATILSRRNATLFKIAIDALSINKKVYFVGGLAKYDLEMLIAIANLEVGLKVDHQFINKFKDISSLESYADSVGENDILMFARLVKQTTGKRILKTITRLLELDKLFSANLQINLKQCDYLLTTAHRSKGLELEQVVVADDFTTLYKFIEDDWISNYRNNTLSQQDTVLYEQEVNLYYVAVTRAQKKLILMSCIIDEHMEELKKNETLARSSLQW